MSESANGHARRLFRLVRELRKRPWNLHELEAELQVSAAQLRRDLAFLRTEIAEDGLVMMEEGAGRQQKQVWIETAAPPPAPRRRARAPAGPDLLRGGPGRAAGASR